MVFGTLSKLAVSAFRKIKPINVRDGMVLSALARTGKHYLDESTLSDLTEVALTHPHWAFRLDAIACLGRNLYTEDKEPSYGIFSTLSSIAERDDHPINRGDALAWLNDYDAELIKYRCGKETSNPFGQGWDRIVTPAEAIVGAIDSDGYNTELSRIGLSAMQMRNLGLERNSAPLDAKSLLKVMKLAKRGLMDGQDFGQLAVEYNGTKLPAEVYNAFGMRAIGGCGIRVSSILAEELGLKLEDKVKLYVK